MKTWMKRFLTINLGVAIMASGLYLFLIPANLAVGGVTGLAMIIQTYIPGVNLGALMIGFNLVLFTIAFIVIGKEFGGFTIYCSFFLSGVIGGFEWLMPHYSGVTNDLMLNLIFGILIQGIGMALIFYENASTGGTDILAKILHKYFKVNIGKSLFLSDALITLGAGLAFGPVLGLYAFLGIMINGLVIDKVIAGFNTKIQVMVLSQASDTITDFIHDDLKRGTTYFKAVGGYSKDEKKMISVLLSRKQYMALKHFIMRTDPHAFVSVSFVHEVFGEGFDLGLRGVKA